MGEAGRRMVPVMQIQVPLARQATSYTCGVAALQSVLHYFGRSYRQDVLAEALHADPEQGTNYKRMATFAQANGIACDAHREMSITTLRAMIDEGRPVIIALQAWGEAGVDYAAAWDDGHYVVVVGHDADHFYFMDPSVLGNYTYLPIEELCVRWHDCYLEDGQIVRLNHFALAFTGTTVAYDPDACVPMG